MDHNINEGIILLQGGKQLNKYETDGEPVFHQESSFQYLFGVKEADCYGYINIKNGKSTLLFPRLPEAYAVWMGKIHPPSYFRDMYQVDEGRYVDELSQLLQEFKDQVIYTLQGLNTDSGLYAQSAHFEGIDSFKVDKDILYPCVVKCRVYKTKKEIELMRYVNDITCDAHMAVMKHIKPGFKEFQMESIFNHWCYFKGGARFQAYTCICASGENGAVLHYGHAGFLLSSLSHLKLYIYIYKLNFTSYSLLLITII